MSGAAITLKVTDGGAWLTFARPETRNAVDFAFAHAS